MTNNFRRNYEQSKDLHTRKIVIYAKAADSKLYIDAEYSTQITEEELQEAFKKGMLLIELGEDEYAEVVKVKDNKAYTVDVVSTAVSLVEWSAEAAA